MSDARARLTRLVELAGGTAPEERRKLAVELCDLLLDWPDTYPAAMREPFETLLEKTIRLIDRESRAALIARFAQAPTAPLGFLNEFFFEAAPDLRAAILARNAEHAAHPAPAAAIDETALVTAARTEFNGEFSLSFARALTLPQDTAERILHDASGEALAIAARGAGISRATFSTLALIADGVHTDAENATRLSAYELIPPRGAEALLAFWRSHAALSFAA